ncbi:MAG: glycine cleavage T C-terminal barrel domain-containing protein [Planctomycetota bacterium]
MAHRSPLVTTFEREGAVTASYGPEDGGIDVTQTFGHLELEYAALRNRCVLLDRPDGAVIRIAGADRMEFLNNMLTQELAGVASGDAVRSFWLSRKGRIVADLLLLIRDDHIVAHLDAFTASAFVDSLGGYVMMEDTTLEDVTDQAHRLELIGPTAVELLSSLAGDHPTRSGMCIKSEIAGCAVLLDRDDALGVPAIGLTLAAQDAVQVAQALLAAGSPAGLDRIGQEDGAIADDRSLAARVRLRLAGWQALNIARIEAGLPRFMLDFGPSSLPAETGLLDSRVSFTKGCFLGQEIVARMKSLGHPKQVVVGLRCESKLNDTNGVVQPQTGSVLSPEGELGVDVGAVTSATLSPTLGGVPVALATVKWGYHEPGTRLVLTAEGQRLAAEVQPGLATAPVIAANN